MTGLVSPIIDVEMEPGDPDVFVAVAQVADTDMYDVGLAGDSARGSGAGLSYHDACMAAVGESLERYALRLVQPEDVIHGTFAGLVDDGRDPISPSRWALFAPAQADSVGFALFDDHTDIGWLEASNLSTRTSCLVPACMVFIDYAAHARIGEEIVAPGISTGAATGGSRAEALLKGVCETVERDAFMISWRNELPLPEVIIDSRSQLAPVFAQRFVRPGLEYKLFHTTLDIALPSFFGVLRDKLRAPAGVIVGGAAHPNPEVAALKTLLELVQGLKWMDLSADSEEFPRLDGFTNVRSFRERMYLYALNDMSDALAFLDAPARTVPLSSLAAAPVCSVSAALRCAIEAVRVAGLEVIGIDITPVEGEASDLFVTRVLVPGATPMEGDHVVPFLGGERWKEVPARLGLESSGRSVTTNPYPHPYP